MFNLLKKLFALFLFTQVIQAYTNYRLNQVADQFTVSNGVRPVVLPPASKLDRLFITYAANEDIDESTAKVSYVSL